MTILRSDLENHWIRSSESFNKNYDDLALLFSSLIPLLFKVTDSLGERKRLPENCTYLLLSKGINHFLSMHILTGRGLLIDASLSARNAIETFLMIELFATDSTEKYYSQWANGKEFKPSWVREQLGSSLIAVVRDVEIRFDDDFYETIKLAYSFFSKITHSNLKSAEHSIRLRRNGHLEIPTGGNLVDKEALIRCLFVVTSTGLIRSLLISSAIFSTQLLKEIGPQITKAHTILNKA